MKRVMLSLAALFLLAPAIGCHPMNNRGSRAAGCPHCGPGVGHGNRICDGLVSGRWARSKATDQAAEAEAGEPGPPTAGVAYPYYTLRGPRDFLMDNPPSIGR